MTWLSLLTALRRIPAAVYMLVAGVLAIAALTHSIMAYGESRYAEGKRDAARGAAFDSVLVSQFSRVREVEVLKTDTIVQRLTVTRHRVDTLIQQLPDSVRTLPSVAPLVATVRLLTVQVDSLTMQIDTERAAHRMERDVLVAQATAQRITINVLTDSVQTLEKRPTWTRAGALAVVAAAAGAIGGLLR